MLFFLFKYRINPRIKNILIKTKNVKNIMQLIFLSSETSVRQFEKSVLKIFKPSSSVCKLIFSVFINNGIK